MLKSPQETLAQRLKAGEEAAFHELITTHGPCMLQMATRLLENGLNIQEVQHIMGHADQKTTSRYLHASTQLSAKRAADVLNKKTESPLLKVVHK